MLFPGYKYHSFQVCGIAVSPDCYKHENSFTKFT